MKNLFYNLGEFMYRRPTWANEKIDYTEDEIRYFCGNPEFREKVYVASPALLDMMDNYLANPEQLSEKKQIGLQVSIIKYLIRSRTRTTPFGLFAGVGIGNFSKESCFPKVNTKAQKKVNIDSEWLFGLINNIENEHIEKLQFKFNDACYIKGNRVILVYTTEKDTEEISVRYSKVFRTLYESVKDYKKYETIIGILQNEYSETSIEKIKSYINELIKKGFLLSNLRPSFNNQDPVLFFIGQCQKVPLFEISQKVIEIKDLCEEYEKTEIGEGIEIYNKIIEKMKELFLCSSYLQVDTVIENGKFQLNSNISNAINELASFFVYISNSIKEQHGHLEHYKYTFMEKYGVDREVQLLEMIDPNKGIGAPALYFNPHNDFYDEYTVKDNYKADLKNYLIAKYEAAIASNTDINLDFAMIEQITDCSVNEDEIPVSLELYFNVKQKNGDMFLVLSPISGSYVAGKTIGRFSVLSENFADLLAKCNAEERKIREKTIDICEISFLPSVIRNGNIVRTLSFRDKETAIFTNGNRSAEDRIELKDIYIGLYNERFYARDKKSGKLVVFESNNMYNPMLNPNVFRFLQEISYDGKRAWAELPWNYVYAGFRHIPTIKYKGIVLQNEQWKISFKEMGLSKNSFNEFLGKFKDIVTERNIPSKICISDADNRIQLDLNKEISLHVVYDELKKHKDRDLILEKVEEEDDIIYDDGLKYSTEIVVPLFRKNNEQGQLLPPSKMSFSSMDHMVLPFNDWLYLKLYCNQNREEEMIAFYIMDFCESVREKYGVEYFFMRYIDPKPHIRLRFHAPQSLLLQVYPMIINWYSEMFNDQIVGDMNISVYDREIERYGGLILIEIAEKLFCKDSYVVESILRLKRLGQLTIPIEDIAVISIIMYVIRFYEDFESQLQFLTTLYHSSEFISEFKKKKDTFLIMCDFEKNWENLQDKAEGKLLYDILRKRDSEIDLYRDEISRQNSELIFKNDIVASVIHLHCNRLLGTNRGLERKLMSFAESILYAKRYNMKRGKKDEQKKD